MYRRRTRGKTIRQLKRDFQQKRLIRGLCVGLPTSQIAKQLHITPQVEKVFRSLMRVDHDGRIHPRLSRANHLRILRAMWEEDPLALLRGIGVPTLVVGTRREDAEGAEAMFVASKELGEQEVRKIGGPVRFRWIEGIHDVPLQHPDAVAELVREFAGDAPP